jgi:hypothetical protein
LGLLGEDLRHPGNALVADPNGRDGRGIGSPAAGKPERSHVSRGVASPKDRSTGLSTAKEERSGLAGCGVALV